MQTKYYKHPAFYFGIIALALFVGSVVYANPSFYAPRKKMAAATTTIAYMTPGTATTTFTYDTWQNQGNTTITENNVLSDLSLAIQLTASSTIQNATSTVLSFRYEYSSDNDDWYPVQLYDFSDRATTTVMIKSVNTYQMTVSSSSPTTLTSALPDGSVRDQIIVKVPVIARYVRAIFSLIESNPNAEKDPQYNGAVWAEFIPQKENPER